MEEQRKLKRRELLYSLQPCNAKTGEPCGRIIDMTAEGLRVSGKVRFVPGELLDLEFKLPDEPIKNKKIVFSAKVRWCKPDVNIHYFATGMQFFSLAPEDRKTIVSLMMQYPIPD